MFSIEVPYMNLNQIYSSTQNPRWMKLKDSKYIILFKNQALKIEQAHERLIMSCTDEQFYDTWFNYFDIKFDYLKVNCKMGIIEDCLEKDFKACVVRSKGMRIIKQDVFEVIVSQMIRNKMERRYACDVIHLLCKLCGTKHRQAMREAGQIVWYEFPNFEEILSQKDKMGRCKLGKVWDSIEQLCEDIKDGWIDLESLREATYEEAKETLNEFCYIDKDIIEAICLFGLNHKQAFPTDKYSDEFVKRNFDCEYEIFEEWYLNDVKEYRGLAQQYVSFDEMKRLDETIKGDLRNGLNR